MLDEPLFMALASGDTVAQARSASSFAKYSGGGPPYMAAAAAFAGGGPWYKAAAAFSCSGACCGYGADMATTAQVNLLALASATSWRTVKSRCC